MKPTKRVAQVIDDLVSNNESEIPFSKSHKSYRLITGLDCFEHDFFDIVLSEGNKPIGYVNLARREHNYELFKHNHFEHPCFANFPNVAIEVKPESRERGFGYALLSLAIGFAQKDFKDNKTMEHFEVVAHDIYLSVEKFYNRFGFRLDVDRYPGMFVGYYTKKRHVPEINIKF